MSTRGTFTGRFCAALALFVTLAIGLAAPWAQAQEHSKLDVRTRIALAHRRGLSASIEAAREAGAAVNQNGDLDVFIRGDVTRAQLEALGVTVRTELPGLFTAYVPPDVVDQVAGLSSVKSITGAVLCEANLASSIPASGISIDRGPGPTFAGINGAGVLISDVDTGIDFSRTDFKTNGGLTRIINIWDQTVATLNPPAPYTYGREWTQAQIDGGTCTETDPSTGGGHGTHCMGIAAGDGSDTGNGVPAHTYAGVSPMADILEIKSGLQTTRIIDGVAYAFARATARGQNAVQNLSLGSQFGPHDGTSAFESALTAMTGPGRIIVVSAGNERSNPDSSRHAGWVMGAGPDSAKMSISGAFGNGVPGSSPTVAIDGYYSSSDVYTVTLRAPNGTLIGPVTLGTSNAAYPGLAVPGAGTIYIENGIDTAPNGDPEIYFELCRTSVANTVQGTWTFLFNRVSGSAGGRVDMYQYFTGSTAARPWFTLKNTVDRLVSEPGNATGVITVAAWTTAQRWTDCNNHSVTASFSIAGQVQPAPPVGNIAVFSSPGPSRNGAQKPDIAAPGLFIASTKSDDFANACPANPATLSALINDGANHVINQGTSMAAPHVAGAAAMLMQKYGAMTPDQVKTYLNAHATVDGFTGAPWNKDFGNGKLNVGDLLDPTVAVTSPNGGESLGRCTSASITWTATDNVAVTTVDIQLSRSGAGGPFENIALGAPNTGSFAWTVSGPLTANAFIKLTAHDNNGNAGSDLSNAAFSIVDLPATIAAQTTTTTICPTNSCVTLPVNISRACPDAVLGYSVTFQLSSNLSLCAGTSSVTEGTFLSGTGPSTMLVIDNGGGSYTVDGTILSNCGPTAPTGNLFNVAVTSSDAGGSGSITVGTVQLRDCSNNPLPVAAGAPGTVPIDNQAPSVAVLSPNGAESWVVGSSHPITWTATDNTSVASVDIAYSTDGGATYPNAIATGIANSGSYAWSVPNTLTTQARVRVTAHDAGCSSASDASDADFTIRNPIILASAGSGGSINPSGSISVTYGTDQSFTISPSDNCHAIVDVLVDGSSVGAVGSYTFNNVTTDHTIAASFALQGPYTILATAGAGGTIDPSGSVLVACGGSQAFLIAAADDCHAIQDVLVDGVSQGAISTYTFTDVHTNHTIAATFSTFGPFTIHASAGTGGTIDPSGDVAVSCGVNQAFTIAANACFHIVDVLVDGASQGAITTYTFNNVHGDHTIAASFAANPLSTTAVTGLAAQQQRNGNDGDGTTKTKITYTTPAGAAVVEVWRKGFGDYPIYDNGTGAAPSLPASYPPAGWTLTAVSASGQNDETTSRDYWYFVAYAKDACGNVAAVSNMTTGTLGYHLGDVSDGVTPGQGDNRVSTPDISLLGAHYGLSGAALAGYEYLDVGPTTDNSVNGRPTTDSKTNFEDLVIFALNYFPAASLATGPTVMQPEAVTAGNMVAVGAPGHVEVGQVFEAQIWLSGNGTLQAVSASLGWNASVAVPMDASAGAWLSSQGGVMLSPEPGKTDAAILGVGRGLAGEGQLATVTFRAVAAGSPDITIHDVVGRDAGNGPIVVDIGSPLAVQLHAPATTALATPFPNPSQGRSMVQWSLATRGPVDLAIYSVDGRRVRSLMHGIQEAGQYQVLWNGTDEHGSLVHSGTFYLRLEASGNTYSKVVTLVR